MPVTVPGYKPGNFASSQFQYGVLLNDLNTNDPAIYPELISKYGTENYLILLTALNRTIVQNQRVYNKQFSHYEDRNLHSSLRAAAQVTGTGAGAPVTVTAHSSDYYSSGTKSPIVVGHNYVINSSGVQVQCISANTATANAHTFTIKPINTADSATSAGSANILAGELFLDRGAVNIGEGSDKISGLGPIWDQVTNTTTEHRDDFNISDVADSEKQRIGLEGTNYYRMIATDKMNKRYMNDQFVKLLEGVAANNIAGTYGTKGAIPQIAANGINAQYTAGSLALADIAALVRSMNNAGGAGEYHAIVDNYAKEAITDLLETYYKGTFNQASFQSVGGTKESAAAYGFDTFRMNGITLHMLTNPTFSTEAMYKRTATVGNDYYKNFCLFMPQRLENVDPRSGATFPSMQIVYQAANDNGDKIDTFETGGKAPSNKTTKMERNLTMISYPGVRLFGANQFAIMKGI